MKHPVYDGVGNREKFLTHTSSALEVVEEMGIKKEYDVCMADVEQAKNAMEQSTQTVARLLSRKSLLQRLLCTRPRKIVTRREQSQRSWPERPLTFLGRFSTQPSVLHGLGS